MKLLLVLIAMACAGGTSLIFKGGWRLALMLGGLAGLVDLVVILLYYPTIEFWSYTQLFRYFLFALFGGSMTMVEHYSHNQRDKQLNNIIGERYTQ